MDPTPSPHPAEALLDKCFDQGLTPAEQAQLEAWLCADPGNADAFARWMLAHAQMPEALARLAPPPAELPADKSVAGRLGRKKQASSAAAFGQFALIAAALALALGAGLWVLLKEPAAAPGQAVAVNPNPPPAGAPEPTPQPGSKTKVAHGVPKPLPAPPPGPAIALAPDEKSSPASPVRPRIPFPSVQSLETALISHTLLQRALVAFALFGGSPAVAQQAPPPPSSEPPSLPPAGLPPPSAIAAEADESDPIGIAGLGQMTPSIQGCHKMVLRGDYFDALKRLDDLKTKKLKPEETAAVLKMIDYAYASGLEPQIKAIETADPLNGLRLLNLMKPPNATDFYAPKLKARMAALEAKLRDPGMKAIQDAGREFERIYEQYEAYPEEAKPKLEAFVAGHANDPYGAMAARVLEGKPPVEDADLAVAGGAAGHELDQANLLYPSEMGGAKGSVPRNQAELKKVCMDFLAQSERALKADTADAPECDARFWRWLDARPSIRTGLLLAKNPVPPMYAINLAKCYKKFGGNACTKYGQLVLAGCLTEGDITIGGKNYTRDDIDAGERKVGDWLAQNAAQVPLWRFYKEPAKYLDLAGGTKDDIRDGGKLAFASRTYPPRVNCSVIDNLRMQIIQQETRVAGAAWPRFPVAQTPYILLNPVATTQLSKREHEFIWGLYTGRVGMPAGVPAGELATRPPAAPRVGTTVGYGKYGFEYTRPDVSQRRSLWQPSTVVRIIEDGGVCGRMATACSIGEVLLGIPSTPAGQPGHCALMSVHFNGKEYGAGIEQSVTGTWMNTTPHLLGVSPAIAGHEGEAVSWLDLTQTVNRVGMSNYHASLVAAYRAEGASDPSERRNWLELAVRLNPYHMAAIEKIWAMAAEDGVNALNKAMWDAIERLAIKKGKTMDDVVLGENERLILRKLVGAHVAEHYDTAMSRAGNVSAQQDKKEYKIGEGYVQTELTAEQKELAAKAGLVYDEKKEVKEDLELMFRYLVAFQKHNLLYGSTQEIFLKHLSRVDPEIARKMLNKMLDEALKLPLPSNENMDPADTPLYVVITGLAQMDSKLEPKDRVNGLVTLCNLIDKKAPRVCAHNHPLLAYGTTIMVDDAQVQAVYQKVFDLLNKTLREMGEGTKADAAEKKLARDVAKMQYGFDLKRYPLELAAYKALVVKAGGGKLNVGPPAVPKPPIFDKDGRVVKAGDKAASPDQERLRRGEGLTAN